MSTPKCGDRINNYLLEELVGTGSFGTVWRAKHHMFDDLVAIKIPTDADYVQNLRREGVAIHGLRHPNIVRAVDLDPYADPPYLIMEYVPGDSLRQFVDAHADGLPIETAVAIMRGVLSALVVAHEAGVIHRDIKPANILLTERVADMDKVSERSVKVADFGLGRVGGVTTQSIMQSGNHPAEKLNGISGTLAYMSPEQKEGQDTDGRTDLYSCGIVLFEMLTGKRPHGAEVPSALRSDVPERLDVLFQRCYARRERRFDNAAAMLEALAEVPRKPMPKGPTIPTPGRPNTQCPSCHSAVEKGDQFCIQCGRQLVARIPRCPKCEAFVHVADRFCIRCGNDLRIKTA
jgi:eukaryotic-like serine/threonine-protein kinase